MSFPFDDYPQDAMAKELAAPDEQYMRDSAAREAHRIIENLSNQPKKREAPVEVKQAHRIGQLESDVHHLSRECERLSRALETAERERDDFKQKYQDRQRRFEEAIEDRNKYIRLNEAKNTTINNLRKKTK